MKLVTWILVWRFLTGHHHGGHRLTNAGWVTPGTKSLVPWPVSRWHFLPRLQRAGIRLTVLVSFVLTVWGLTQDVTETVTCLVIAGVTALVYGCWLAERKFTRARHWRQVQDPLTAAIANLFGISPQAARGMASIDPGYRKAGNGDRIGTVVLPDSWAANPGQKEAMEHLLRSRTGMSLDFRWSTDRLPMTVTFTKTPVPADLVPLLKMMPVIRDLPADSVLLGVAGTGANVCWDMSSEEPHAFVSARTRRGKTRLLLLIACQVLGQGGNVTVIDPKRVGVDECLAGIDAASVHSDPGDIGDMWQAIRDFRDMMDSRISAYSADRTLMFDRALLVIDEASQFAAQSKSHWDDIREPGQPATPAIWKDISAILWQGAQFKCSILMFGQRIDQRLMANMLDSFGTRLLAGYDKRTYDRLIGTGIMPPSSKRRGRFLYSDGTDQVVIQTVLGDDAELRELALTAQKEKTIPVTTIPTGEIL